MKALILAAGKGTRLSQLTQRCPKPMLPIQGQPLLAHTVQWLAAHDIHEIAMNLHHLPAVITAHFGDGKAYGVSITYSYEPELLGTAGAAKKLEHFLNEPFVVLYGDVFTNFDLSRLIAFHQKQVAAWGAALSLALYHVPNPAECGLVELDQLGRVVRFVEKPPPAAIFTDLANAGILICEPTIFQAIPAATPFDFGRDLLPRLLAADRPVFGMETAPDEYVIDIGTPAGYARAQHELRTATNVPLTAQKVITA